MYLSVLAFRDKLLFHGAFGKSEILGKRDGDGYCLLLQETSFLSWSLIPENIAGTYFPSDG